MKCGITRKKNIFSILSNYSNLNYKESCFLGGSHFWHVSLTSPQCVRRCLGFHFKWTLTSSFKYTVGQILNELSEAEVIGSLYIYIKYHQSFSIFPCSHLVMVVKTKGGRGGFDPINEFCNLHGDPGSRWFSLEKLFNL